MFEIELIQQFSLSRFGFENSQMIKITCTYHSLQFVNRADENNKEPKNSKVLNNTIS